MKTVLVTGASGLLGRYVVAELAAAGEFRVVAVVSGRRHVDFPPNVSVEATDLLQESNREELMKRVRPEICCHFAWALDDGGFQHSEQNLQWLEASLHILRCFVHNGGKQFFCAGSSSEYGNGSRGNTEDAKTADYSLYGMSKRAFEQTAEIFCELNGIDFISGRFFSVYGPWDIRPDAGLPTAIRTMLKGETFVCKAPENLWDYVFVEDCAKATRLLLENRCTGSYNIATGRAMTMRQIFTETARAIGSEELVRFEDRSTQIALTADVSKLRDATGYMCSTSFQEGIQKTIQWWKANGYDQKTAVCRK